MPGFGLKGLSPGSKKGRFSFKGSGLRPQNRNRINPKLKCKTRFGYLVHFPRRNNVGQGGAGRGSHFSRAGQGGAGISDAELSKNFWCLLTLSVARLLEDRFR